MNSGMDNWNGILDWTSLGFFFFGQITVFIVRKKHSFKINKYLAAMDDCK